MDLLSQAGTLRNKAGNPGPPNRVAFLPAPGMEVRRLELDTNKRRREERVMQAHIQTWGQREESYAVVVEEEGPVLRLDDAPAFTLERLEVLWQLRQLQDPSRQG